MLRYCYHVGFDTNWSIAWVLRKNIVSFNLIFDVLYHFDDKKTWNGVMTEYGKILNQMKTKVMVIPEQLQIKVNGARKESFPQFQ